MLKILNFSLFVAAHSVASEAVSAAKNTPQNPALDAKPQNTGVSNSTPEPASTLMPSSTTSNQNAPMTYQDKHIAKLKKCLQDFSGDDNKFARVQCIKYTDIGMTCEKASNSSNGITLSCVDKNGLEIEVPISEIKEEINIKKEAGGLNPHSRLYKMYVKKTSKDLASNTEKKESPTQEKTQMSGAASATPITPTPQTTSTPQQNSATNTTPAALPGASAGK